VLEARPFGEFRVEEGLPPGGPGGFGFVDGYRGPGEEASGPVGFWKQPVWCGLNGLGESPVTSYPRVGEEGQFVFNVINFFRGGPQHVQLLDDVPGSMLRKVSGVPVAEDVESCVQFGGMDPGCRVFDTFHPK
jgi:hypothetical protein